MSRSIRKKKGYFSISAVAQMFTVHQQTIRLYEKQGLISPKRSEGNTRLFSEEDVERLEEIMYLTHKLGINLAGVDMILKLQKQIKKLQKEMNTIFEQAQKELAQDDILLKADTQKALIELRALKKDKAYDTDSD
jgi:MerR family transcriptional regulator, heat shock protein HspR